ncbi:hypothetical protein OKW43_008496 [Paraburkholderia sp. WC7.3g]
MLAEPIRPPLINSTSSQYKQYFAYRSRSLFDPYCDKAVMGAGTGFHADEARRQLGDEQNELVPHDARPNQHNLAGLVHSVNRKHVLGQIDSHGDNRHGLPLLLVLMKLRDSIMAL